VYRANNGILTAVLTAEEAREHFAAAEVVDGHFGGRFTTAIRAENGYGRRVEVAVTTYEPVDDASVDELEDLAAA
jgi:hypothetical protein